MRPSYYRLAPLPLLAGIHHRTLVPCVLQSAAFYKHSQAYQPQTECGQEGDVPPSCIGRRVSNKTMSARTTSEGSDHGAQRESGCTRGVGSRGERCVAVLDRGARHRKESLAEGRESCPRIVRVVLLSQRCRVIAERSCAVVVTARRRVSSSSRVRAPSTSGPRQSRVVVAWRRCGEGAVIARRRVVVARHRGVVDIVAGAQP